MILNGKISLVIDSVAIFERIIFTIQVTTLYLMMLYVTSPYVEHCNLKNKSFGKGILNNYNQ
jgi:hypothetical protein